MGYSPLLSGHNDPENGKDLQEGFEFGWEDLDRDDSGARDKGVMAGKNVWPESLPEFRKAALEY